MQADIQLSSPVPGEQRHHVRVTASGCPCERGGPGRVIRQIRFRPALKEELHHRKAALLCGQSQRLVEHPAWAACRVGRELTSQEIETFRLPTPVVFDIDKRSCPPVFSWQ